MISVVGSDIGHLRTKDLNRLLCYRLRMKSEAISRRTFMAMAGAVPLALAAQTGTRKIPVGIELYSVRDELAKDMPGTLRTVAKQGYEVVEFFSPYFDWTPQIAMEARKVMDDAGIKCNSTHNNTPSFTVEGLKKAIELNQIIGSRNIIMAQGPRITTLDGWKALGEQLTHGVGSVEAVGNGNGISQSCAGMAAAGREASDGCPGRKQFEGCDAAVRRRHLRGGRPGSCCMDQCQPRPHSKRSLQGLGRRTGTRILRSRLVREIVRG